LAADIQKAVVSGASGFVGRALVSDLLTHDVKVIAIIRPDSLNKSKLSLHKNLEIIEWDLSNILNIKKEPLENADVFYHLGWEGSAGSARADAALQLKNVMWSLDAVRLAKETACKKFVGAGSIMEKETYYVSCAQGTKPAIAYIYGAAKLTAHNMTKALAAELGICHVWALITNAYGEGEYSPRFINTTIRKIINCESLEFTSGTQNYDFVHISDIARAFRLLGEKGKPFYQYTLGSGGARPLRSFVEELGRCLADSLHLHFGDVPYTGINLPLDDFSTDALVRDTGFTPEVSFSEGLKKTYEWILAQKKGEKR
jgi:nucleoside-diphosphate-sugar epimerase